MRQLTSITWRILTKARGSQDLTQTDDRDGLQAILAAGVDLSNHEVKSAVAGGSYEYQYHKDTGKNKLAHDMKVGHLFCEHGDNLRKVNLRYAHGSQLKEFFQKRLDEYPDPYQQRYRRSIPFGWVQKNGTLLMTITDGEVTFPESAPIELPSTKI